MKVRKLNVSFEEVGRFQNIENLNSLFRPKETVDDKRSKVVTKLFGD